MLFGFASALSAASAGPLWAAPVAAPLSIFWLFSCLLSDSPFSVACVGPISTLAPFFPREHFALSEHFAVSLERRLSHSSSCLAPSCPPPSSNIAAVVDNSRRFLRDVSFGGPRPLGRLNVAVWMHLE